MGLFKRAGRKVERLKRSVEAVADGEASYFCTACGERYYAQREACEACGGDVVSVEGSDEDDEYDEAKGPDDHEGSDEAG